MMFHCPFCRYDKKVPDNFLNKKIKCPRCLATLTLGIPQPTALTALPLPDDDISPLDQKAIEMTQEGESMQECPLCFELISFSEKECPYCHCILEQKAPMRTETSYKSQAQEIFYYGMASLIVGMGLIFGIFSFVLGRVLKDIQNPKERELAYAGIVMATLGITGSLVFWIGLCLF